MISERIKKLIKISEKRGKMDYQELMTWCSLLGLQDNYRYSLFHKVNKLISKPEGRKLVKDDVVPLDPKKMKYKLSKGIRQSFSDNSMFLESFGYVVFCGESGFIYKESYKMLIPLIVKYMTNARLHYTFQGSSIDVTPSLESAEILALRDEEIIRNILAQIPNENYPLIDRRYDLLSESKSPEFDLRGRYFFEFHEDKILRRKFGKLDHIGSFKDYKKLTDLERSIVTRWVYSEYETIKDFIELSGYKDKVHSKD